jgi:O-antigen/teichoic acid export membrane protein
VFGHDFEAGWVILVIGTAGQLVNCAVGSVGYLLLMSGHERRLVRIQLVAGVVTVSCCLLLVPRWGIVGAAVAAALGNAGSNAWCLWEVKKVLGLFPYNRGYWRLAMPAGVALATAIGLRIVLQPAHPDILVVVFAMVSVYAVFAGAVLLSGLEADDRLIAAAIWARIRGIFPGSQEGVA